VGRKQVHENVNTVGKEQCSKHDILEQKRIAKAENNVYPHKFCKSNRNTIFSGV